MIAFFILINVLNLLNPLVPSKTQKKKSHISSNFIFSILTLVLLYFLNKTSSIFSSQIGQFGIFLWKGFRLFLQCLVYQGMNKHAPNMSIEKNESQRSEDAKIVLKDEYFSSLKQVISPEKKRPEGQQNSIFLGYQTVTLVFEAKFIVQSFLAEIWLKQILKALNKQMEFIGIYKIVNEEEKMGEKSQSKQRYIQSYYTLVIEDEQTEEESLKIDQANIEFEILREIFTKLKDQKAYTEGDRAQIITEQLKALIQKYF